ncbi:MAG: 4-hydroxyacetophenone monooxygenase [Halioglobus sp.]|jgi:4-hydroxyacetophenone monooxygenase
MGKGSAESFSDFDWLEAAIALANIPTLLCLLVQLTGDRAWIEGRYVPSRPRGLDDNDTGGLPDEVQAEVRAAALACIQGHLAGKPLQLPRPSDELLVEMMGVSLRETIPGEYAPMIRHELGFGGETTIESSPMVSNSSATPPLPGELMKGANPPEGFSVVIIGAGISGLCAAVNLTAAGIPFTILERHHRLGGVWHENKYPGAACDVPSHLYSFSFAPYNWSQFFAGSDEIQDYLEYVADHFNIRRHIKFGVEVTQASFDEDSETWEIAAIGESGSEDSLRASAVISAVGAFNKPKYPEVSGKDSFAGKQAHTARWPDEGIDLAGRNVVVIGNGASAMQVVPAIADRVASLTVIQRSTQWATPFPKFKQAVPEVLQRLMEEVPLYRLWYRLRLSWAFNDKLYEALQRDPTWEGGKQSINAINDSHRKGLTKYMVAELGNAQHLLPQVLPDYPPLGKRILLDNGWFRTLAREHVNLVNGSVTEVKADGVVTDAGDEYEADVLIWATGFDVVNFLAPMKILGIGGRELHDDWEGDNARAYLGTVVPGYPNFFCLYGPNTQFGHGGSLISIVERQMHYVMSVLQQMFKHEVRRVDVRRDVYDAFTAEVDRKHEGMIWTHPGVSNYYCNSRGRVVVCNPFRIIEFWQMTDRADLAHYTVTSLDPNSGPGEGRVANTG